MDKLRARSDYVAAYLAARPDGTSREAREWMEQTGLAAETAAELAGKGWTPATVAARMETADDDGLDPDAAVDAMLYGPDADRDRSHG